MSHAVEFIIDDRVARIDQGQTPLPADWASRSVYRGKTGAKNWLAVVEEPGYPLRHPDKLGLWEKRRDAVRGLNVRTLVSLGPGDAVSDRELLAVISGESRDGSAASGIKYIPVDISRVLLETAIATMQQQYRVPAAIQCDFEEGQQFLGKALDQWAGPPRLFALLGGTLGNLDRGESRFFEGLRGIMHADDAFLVDIPLAGAAWTPEKDPRLKPEGYTPVFRRFLGAALAPRNSATNPPPGCLFENQVAFSLQHDDDTGAEVITVSDCLDGHPMLRFRRYHWQPVLQWFEERRFAVQFSWCSLVSEHESFGMGVVLLKIR
jgi:hypothetical protein